MFKALFVAAITALSLNASANTINTLAYDLAKLATSDVETSGFNWVVGDQANYKMSMGGFINGTMTMTVKAVSQTELVLAQDMDLGFMGKQNCDIAMNPGTGEITKLTCNGQNQNIPKNDMEVIDMKEDTVTVPAGTFEKCMYIKVQNKENNEISQQWANPSVVPVMGMIKALSPSQFGEVSLELTSFKKN